MKLNQRVKAAAFAQFGRPTGLWGRGAGLLMAHRSSNRRRNAWAVSLLDVRPDDRVLEIGFGPGLAIRQLSRIAHEGYVCGIDHSELMLRQARRRNADGIRRGVVDLRLASVDALPAFDAPFDKILAVNAVLFWTEPDARLEALRRLLRPGGLIAVAHQPRGPGATDETSAAKGQEIAAALTRAGCSEVRVETLRLKPAVVCVNAKAQAATSDAGPATARGWRARPRRRPRYSAGRHPPAAG
jgi:ubiquinone/menaquinone biosynthesis C-methylase UbiE